MQNTHDLLVGTLSIGIPSLFLIIFIHLTCKNIFVLMLGIFDEKDYRRLSLLQTSNCSYVALRYSLECLKNAHTLVISNRTHAVRLSNFKVTRMISDQIALHSNHLPISITQNGMKQSAVGCLQKRMTISTRGEREKKSSNKCLDVSSSLVSPYDELDAMTTWPSCPHNA